MTNIPSWDELFLRQVYLIASKSRDPRSKIGSVIVNYNSFDCISQGFNNFARNVQDLDERYLDREFKNKIIVHSEINSIFNAARKGISTLGCTLFTQIKVCHNCANAIIQAGIREIVYHKQALNLMDNQKWAESQGLADILLDEAGIFRRYVDVNLQIETLIDGKLIKV